MRGDSRLLHPVFYGNVYHEQRFISTLQELGKVGKRNEVDPYWASALYILTSDSSTWMKAKNYIQAEENSIQFEKLLADIDFSHAYSHLIIWAWDLFTNGERSHPMDLFGLDAKNFEFAQTALAIRFCEPSWPILRNEE